MSRDDTEDVDEYDEDDEDIDDAEETSAGRPTKPVRAGLGLGVLLMLVVWAVGAWFTYAYAFGSGVVANTELRSGTLTVTSCTRSPVYAMWLYRCDGEAAFAPQSTWAVNPSRLPGRSVTVLSPTRLSGTVEFTSFRLSRSSYDHIVEYALPSDTYAAGGTFAGSWRTLALGAGVLVGGVAVAIMATRLRRALGVGPEPS